MKVDRDLVLQIAKLAHMELTDEEVQLFTTQLGSILQYVEKLNEESEQAEPFVFDELLSLPFREDIVTPSLTIDASLQNAPDRKKNFFRVPRIIP
ncbi:Asp-tRNA(Asn)/Glu-tRNA(Gln) amidotransferase subunit GatC [bacterium]|nr:Asp-tRNA(Asn)/Glu-tRNA(Gln) amidotransferase subunit GatC [bacterium]